MPNKRTYPSKIKRIKELFAWYKLSAVFELVDKEMDEETDKSVGKQSRNRSQIPDFKKNYSLPRRVIPLPS